jgi:hypothetical protein
MFLLNNQVLPQGVPFKDAEGNQYPANWLNLSTAEEKAAIGITEIPDPVRADDRFYWDGDVTNPKDINQVKAMLVSQVKTAAGSMLAQSDWKVIRASEGIKPVDADTLAWRESIRTASNNNETAINACTTVDELAVLQLPFPQVDRNV